MSSAESRRTTLAPPRPGVTEDRGDDVTPIDVGLQTKIAALRSSALHASTHEVRFIETHFACVFLIGRHAYKLKKPMRAPGFDMTTLSEREHGCREELRLNRRLAADVYLDVVPLKLQADGALTLHGAGETVDWLVHMVRLPADAMLDHALRTGQASPGDLEPIGDLLADFYCAQPRIPLEPESYLHRIERQMVDDINELRAEDLHLSPCAIATLEAEQQRAFATVSRQLEVRAAAGHIVECHGDLRPEHVCLRSPRCIIDALEFSLDLRTMDPLEELAFFTMECERAGARWAGNAVVRRYVVRTRDCFRPNVFDFYISRRATVRAKVLAWHVRDPLFPSTAVRRRRADLYLDVAHAYAAKARAH